MQRNVACPPGVPAGGAGPFVSFKLEGKRPVGASSAAISAVLAGAAAGFAAGQRALHAVKHDVDLRTAGTVVLKLHVAEALAPALAAAMRPSAAGAHAITHGGDVWSPRACGVGV